MSRVAHPRSKSDLAYRRLRELIAAGGFTGEERLTESKLAEQLGMSRGPVRESLLRLHAEGLLHSTGNRRSRVIMYTEDENPHELLLRYEVREQIQGGAARMAAKNMNGWQIDRLRELAERVEHCRISRDAEARFAAAAEFHHYLLAHCGNPILRRIWDRERLEPPRPRSLEFEQKLLGYSSAEQPEDPSLIDVVNAIAAHDQDRAELLTRQRIRQVSEALRKNVALWETSAE